MAKLFLESNDTSYKVSNSNTTIFGATGDQAVVIDGSLTGITINSNVERVQFTGSTTDYTYKVVGTNLEVYKAGALVSTVGVQSDTTGTQLTFANGTVDAKITGLNAATVGGQAVSSTAAAAVTIPATAIDTTIASAPTPVFSVSAPVTSVTEAAGAVASFTVSLNAAQPAASTVSFALGNVGSATTADYGTAALTAVTGGATLAGSVLTFPAGITTATITVPVTVDAATETGEGVSLTLSAPSTGATVGTATAQVLIQDPPTPVFSLAAAATSVGEGTPAVGTTAAVAAGTIALTVTRAGNTTGTDSVVVQATSGTGTNGAISASDFVALSQTVTFAAGETSKTVTFTSIADSTREGDETLTVALGTPSAGATIASGAGSVTLTITNDDANIVPVITVPTTTPSAFIADSTAVTGISFTDGDDNTGFTVTVQAAGSSQVSFSNLATSVTAKNAANIPMSNNEISNTIVLSGTKADLNTTLGTLKYTTNSTVPTSEQVTITIADSAGGTATKTLPINIGTSKTLAAGGTDSLVGSAGDDIFSGTLANFLAGDTIVGSTGTDKLTLTSVDGALPTLTTAATGIEVLDLTMDLLAADQTASFSAVNFGSTLTTVNFTTNNATVAGSADTGDSLTATTANTGTVFNMQNSAGTLTVSGINGTASTTDAFTVNLAGGVALTAFTGANDVVDVLNINSNGTSANSIGTITLNTAATLTATINVAGAQDISLGTLPNLGTGVFNGASATGKITVTANAADSASITGGSAGDVLTGNAGLDTITGGAGNDTIDGAAGNDVITGGTGIDSLTGGAGVDTFIFAVGDSPAATRDTISDLAENDIIKFGTALTGLTNGATLTTSSANTIYVDNVNNRLVVGSDSINIPASVANATFTYSYGADSVVGTADDYLTVGAAPFTATNNALGTLTLTGKSVAGVTVTIPDAAAPQVGGAAVGNVAVRTVNASLVTGTDATVNVTGSGSADTITGSAQNDTITGGAGADVLTGGAGADKFQILTAANMTSVTGANVDKITDFVAGTDKIQIDSTTNSGAGAFVAGVTLTTATPPAFAAMNTAVSNPTSVATIADVYTQLALSLANGVGTEFAASAANGTAMVARVVDLTTGASAGKYLVINDSTAAFQAANDVVINITGITGTFAAADFAFV